MKVLKETQTPLDPLEEKIRIMRLGKSLTYYAERLNRTVGAISQALSGHPNTDKLLARIHKHSNWLESQTKEKQVA
jgi:hypothetical protein